MEDRKEPEPIESDSMARLSDFSVRGRFRDINDRLAPVDSIITESVSYTHLTLPTIYSV